MSQYGPPAGQQPPPGWGSPPPMPEYRTDGWGGPPEAPRPGCIPLRALGVGEILEATFTTLRRYPAATFGSSAVVVGLTSLVQLLILIPLVDQLTPVLDAAQSGDGDAVVAAAESISWTWLALGGLLVGLLSFGLFVLLSGLLASVVGQSVIGRPLGLGGAWRRAVPRLPRLLGGVVLVVLLVGSVWLVTSLLWAVAAAADRGVGYAAMTLLTLFGAVPLSIYLGVKASLTTPAIALESTQAGPIGPVTGLRRSWTLVAGGWWRTLGIVLLGAIIAGALSQVVTIPLGIVLSAAPLDPGAALVASVIAAGAGQAISLPISGLILSLVYVDRRIRTEQLDAALARAAGVELPPSAQYR